MPSFQGLHASLYLRRHKTRANLRYLIQSPPLWAQARPFPGHLHSVLNVGIGLMQDLDIDLALPLRRTMNDQAARGLNPEVPAPRVRAATGLRHLQKWLGAASGPQSMIAPRSATKPTRLVRWDLRGVIAMWALSALLAVSRKQASGGQTVDVPKLISTDVTRCTAVGLPLVQTNEEKSQVERACYHR